MSLGSSALGEQAIAHLGGVPAPSAQGQMAPLVGLVTQGMVSFRGVRFWATQTPTRFFAHPNNGDEMLGVAEKDPWEKVWYECDFSDVLGGADIQSYSLGTSGGVYVLSSELKSNGRQRHLVRALVVGGPNDSVCELRFQVLCSDGSARKRSLRIRVKVL